jgi:purine-cytosine permease-like protein
MAQPREGVAGAGAVRASEDHAVNEVPDSERSSTLNITLVRMGFTVLATDLLFGMSLAEFMVGNFGFNLLGIILGLAVGVDELGAAFSVVGVGALATMAIFVQGFPHEINNLYAGSLAGRSALNVPRLFINLAGGVIAAALAYYGVSQGILESVLEYLNYLAYAIPLIPGIIVADYFVLRRGRYGRRVSEAEAVNWRAVLAFWIGLGVNLYLGLALDDTLWRSLPLIGFVLYLALSARRLVVTWSPRAEPARRVEALRFARTPADTEQAAAHTERPAVGRDA